MVSCFDRKEERGGTGREQRGGKRKEGRGGREGREGRKKGHFYITIQPSLSQTVRFAKCHGSLLKQWKLHNTSIAPLYKSLTPFSSQSFIYSPWVHILRSIVHQETPPEFHYTLFEHLSRYT